MKCHECRDLLSPYLDNMTSDEENRRITVHLAACRGCYREMQEMKLMLEGLGFFKGEVALPDGYTEELHEKLLAHKTSLWGKQQALPTPRTGGWIAASVAALAIGTGIWVSSFVPYAQMADSLQKAAPAIFDRQHEQVKNTVEKLIADTAKSMQEQADKTGTQGVNQGEPQQVATNESPGFTNPGPTSTTNVTPGKTTTVSPVVVAETPRVAPVVAMRVNVENLDTAVSLLKSEGESQNTQVAVVNDNSIHTLTAGRDRVVSIQVPAAQVDNWTNWLGGLGNSTAPSKRSEDKTREYNQLSQQITSLEKQLATKSTDELQAELQAAKNKLQAIKDSLQLVTINVTLHEDVEQ